MMNYIAMYKRVKRGAATDDERRIVYWWLLGRLFKRGVYLFTGVWPK